MQKRRQEPAKATPKPLQCDIKATPRRMQNAECRMQKAAQSQVQARCRPPASQELGGCSLVFLLCCSCAPLVLLLFPSCVALVSLLFSGGALRRTTAAPSSPKLIL